MSVVFPNLHFKNNFTFVAKNEVFVIHEMWAGREAELAHRKGIKYMIQVQGGYDISRKSDWKAVYFAYQHAQLITCVLQDIYDCMVLFSRSLQTKFRGSICLWKVICSNQRQSNQI